jgi:hypothetical protein
LDIGEIDRFGEYVETLELAVSRLQHDSPARRRQALIGLDNLAEVLMYEICESILESDEFAAKLVPPRFTAKQKTNIRWGFHEKVQLFLEEEILDAEEAELLNILHRYRNPAFHRFDHNPRSAWVIAACSLPAVISLLEQIYGGTMIGGLRVAPDWVFRYSLPASPIDFDILGQCMPKADGIVSLRGALPRPPQRLRQGSGHGGHQRLDRQAPAGGVSAAGRETVSSIRRTGQQASYRVNTIARSAGAPFGRAMPWPAQGHRPLTEHTNERPVSSTAKGESAT